MRQECVRESERRPLYSAHASGETGREAGERSPRCCLSDLCLAEGLHPNFLAGVEEVQKANDQADESAANMLPQIPAMLSDVYVS